ncbi:hypothetical protein ACLOJK_031012 [Asimina triloba]
MSGVCGERGMLSGRKRKGVKGSTEYSTVVISISAKQMCFRNIYPTLLGPKLKKLRLNEYLGIKMNPFLTARVAAFLAALDEPFKHSFGKNDKGGVIPDIDHSYFYFCHGMLMAIAAFLLLPNRHLAVTV